MVDWPAGWNEFSVNGSKIVIPYLGGWLLACTKDAWVDLGGFDPLYGRFDYEDLDISTTALYKGYELVALNLPYLKHMSGATIATLKVDRMAITTKNKEKYIAKWQDRLLQIHANLEVSRGK